MIVPSIDILNGRVVQLEGGDPRKVRVDAGDPFPIAERFALVGEIAVIDLDAAMGTGSNESLVRDLVRRFPCRVGGGIRSLDAARRWLDAGARKIILGTAATPELLSQLPRERIIAALDARDGDVVIEGWTTSTGRDILERIGELREFVGGMLITFVEREGRLGGTDLDRARAVVAAAGDVRVTIAGGVTTAAELRALDDLGADAQIGMALYTGRLDLAESVAAVLRSDRADGLWPTVVCDESGRALGLTYSSRDSLQEAIETRRGVYLSRSRQRIWIKGETSGNIQDLLRVDADCDRDALRFTVRQEGEGFCHQRTRTCFGTDAGLHRLARRLRAPATMRDSGSYTSRLLRDPALLAAKLHEEAGELCRANTAEEVAQEAADVLYFTMARLASMKVKLEDVERILDQRELKVSRRPGNAKPGALASTTAVENPRGPAPPLLPLVAAGDLPRRRRGAVDAETLAIASRIIDDVRTGGLDAAAEHAIRLGDIRAGGPLIHDRAALIAALDQLNADDRLVLERTADRIRSFARAQREALVEMSINIPGGQAGHAVMPVQRVGGYVPGGRFPLPSTALMTAVTAREAGVEQVWLASPRPTPVVLAAAAIAGADGLLAIGGAQAIAALAFGAGPIPPSDMIVGPGNRFVTAAKQLIAGHTAIDMLAGPSELLIIADACADAELVAADLIAQAEHDVDARVWLITDDATLIDRVESELRWQLVDLPTGETARTSLARGGAVLVEDMDRAVAMADSIAPEHLAVMTSDGRAVAAACRQYGAIFIGSASAQVLGDYGIGPNHTLPTAGSARASSGLSVFTFLKTPTWVRIDDATAARGAFADAAHLARLEGLEGHAQSIVRRTAETLT